MDMNGSLAFFFLFGLAPLEISNEATGIFALAAKVEILPTPEKNSIISHSSLPLQDPTAKLAQSKTTKMKS